jgi:hypothetical protein
MKHAFLLFKLLVYIALLGLSSDLFLESRVTSLVLEAAYPSSSLILSVYSLYVVCGVSPEAAFSFMILE